MSKEYQLIKADIEQPRGKTKTELDKLIKSWREGKNQGASEILAVASLLEENDSISNAVHGIGNTSYSIELANKFNEYLVSGAPENPEFSRLAKKYLLDNKVHLFTAGLGSATGALYCALSGVGVAGGEVVTTSLNYMGVINAIVMAGAIPKFVDVDQGTWNMYPGSMQKALSKNTKAVVLTHLNNCNSIEPYADLLDGEHRDIPLIQDASLAVGSRANGLLPGIINKGNGGVTIYSLAVSKNISGLGGAMVVANDDEIIHFINSMANQGLNLRGGEDLVNFGTNFKMSEICAVIALEHLKRCESIMLKRKSIQDHYDECLAGLVNSGKVILQDLGDETIVTHYGISVPDRRSLAAILYDKYSIQTGIWHTHHMQPIYKEYLGHKVPKLPVTESLENRIMFLPFHTDLSKKDVELICDAIALELS